MTVISNVFCCYWRTRVWSNSHDCHFKRFHLVITGYKVCNNSDCLYLNSFSVVTGDNEFEPQSWLLLPTFVTCYWWQRSETTVMTVTSSCSVVTGDKVGTTSHALAWLVVPTLLLVTRLEQQEIMLYCPRSNLVTGDNRKRWNNSHECYFQPFSLVTGDKVGSNSHDC